MSNKYKEIFKYEYLQLKLRIEGMKMIMEDMKMMIDEYSNDKKLRFNYDSFGSQYEYMIMYKSYLEARAKKENINLEEVSK